MKKRSVLAVILLPIVTLGIYSIVWFVKTKKELNSRGSQIPTAWLMIVPIVSIYWMWKYIDAAQEQTNNQTNGLLNILLGLFVSVVIPMALCQSAYNQMGPEAVVDVNPVGPESAPIPPSDQPQL